VNAIQTEAYNQSIGKNHTKWKPGYSDINFDVNGHIKNAIDRVGNRTIQYVSDAQGMILLRDEITGTITPPNYRHHPANYNPGTAANKVARYYYVDGQRVGDISNTGDSRVDYLQSLKDRKDKKSGNYADWTPIASADVDQSYEPIGANTPGNVAGSYTVRSGDTLQSIALSVWGDSAMWFYIADANGLTNTDALVAGTVLTLPNKITNVHNNSGTFRPYSPGEAIGDTSPTLPTAPAPPKPKGGCGGLGAIIVAVVTVAVTVVAWQLGPMTAAALGNLARH
ncbi:LysM domain-containing protein, partial [Pseudomethylobacillus aquaticus]